MPRIFMTGASGFIGSTIAELAITRGYQIYGLSRTEATDAKLTQLGVVPVRGDLHSLDVLRDQSAQADIVMHLADALAGNFGMDYEEVLRIDFAAVDAIGEGLQGSNKPLVVTSGSLVVAPDPTGAETDETSPLNENPLNGRIRAERHALELAGKGVKVSVIRLAPFVYGRGGSGIRLFMGMFKNAGQAFYVDDGAVKTSAVHVDDAAQLYLLAAEQAKAGDVFNGVSSTTVTIRELSEAMGEILDLPVVSLPYDKTVGQMGEFLARFLSSENRGSGGKAERELGWKPAGMGILEDIKSGSYVAVAEGLK
ncbi:hypothetical protein ASPWEDRAFT_111168 [Aspergillus wentii DTO 134E9]|uniref:NAD-dependent epimerase/dehydratase domain-containing protein n=1 Tax=Aspergillus wentii DTO 134E9 TaxID=1073089 RepID=A0A1L9RMI1_ASPWE|nr:uncharacterized protein ASPWEDRAFT_111168 [Aspergillus wentii DTO 134E9]KAI9929529.1 hypothetical protein MW887_001002 [Aspergillus wentii]OJJ36028.1 hypothetical protein ASPWEDRAFT_111168 [Aspergillus wentii DTO 134E9]